MSDSYRPLSLACYNVFNLGRRDYPEPGAYYTKLRFLATVLERLAPDLVVVAEVRESASFTELAEAGLWPGRHLGDAPAEHRRIQTGILTRLPVVEQGQWYNFPLFGLETGEARYPFRRSIPWLRVRLPNGETLFAVGVLL